MQLQSTLSRFAAFVLFMLSFSMLACAAPAPVAAPGALIARGSEVSTNSLVARTDVSNECHQALVDLDVKIDADIALLSHSGCKSAKDAFRCGARSPIRSRAALAICVPRRVPIPLAILDPRAVDTIIPLPPILSGI
ncbi:hypothetical protein BDV93DRAFT_516817 [Ceratobasidium sp. AG-I]|nr:hypothetical protein BDV93DRAFT_516817 [Ceratobasidium sp. AG-I]